MKFPQGSSIGSYEILSLLGSGGMGDVYRCRDAVLGREAALKVLPPEFTANADRLARFQKEARLASSLNHPNIVTIYGVGEHEYISYIAMELVKGRTVADILKQGRVSLQTALDIVVQATDGLAKAHSEGVVHRDIKPQNLMLNEDGLVKILDFGLGKAVRTDHSFESMPTLDATLPGVIMGTAKYMSPEQASGKSVDFRSDQFSLAALFYEMLAGQPPFQAPTVVQLLSSIIEDEPASVSQLNPAVPADLERIVQRCMAKPPEHRFSSTSDLHQELRRIQGTLPHVIAVRPPHDRKKRRIGWSAAIASTALAVGLGWTVLPNLDSVLHPLPAKRFVALMQWPPDSNSQHRPLLRDVLDKVAGRLARAERSNKQLLIISQNDVAGSSLKAPADAVTALGANLVLAASIHDASDGMSLELAVLDATSSKEIRKASLLVASADLSRLPDEAALRASKLLDVQLTSGQWKKDDDLAGVAPAAYEAFVRAEDLAAQPNNSGLDEAIRQYQKAVDADPAFALGYARLSIAYTQKYTLVKEPAILTLALRNADLAIRYRPDSPSSILSRALVDQESGKAHESMDELQQALTLDPGNPQILLYKARLLRDLDRRSEEETVYRAIIQNRPNFWPAYNQLGLNLYRQGKYDEAIRTFTEGSAVAPKAALMYTNRGAMELSLNRKKDAEGSFWRSIQLAPTETAYGNLGTIAFSDGDYRKALQYYEKAKEINPASDVLWRNIGDCYSMLDMPERVKESYAKAAEIVSDTLRINPNRGPSWLSLAFYEAKLAHRTQSETALHEAEQRGVTNLQSQFKEAQVLALLGEKERAVDLLIECLKKGLSVKEIDLAIDLKEIRKNPRYLQAVANKSNN